MRIPEITAMIETTYPEPKPYFKDIWVKMHKNNAAAGIGRPIKCFTSNIPNLASLNAPPIKNMMDPIIETVESK